MRSAQRDADYAYRLAVDPPASKELRLFGLVRWTIDRFVARRTRLHKLQYDATRLRERPLVWSLLIVIAANVIVLWAIVSAAAAGRIDLGEIVVYAQCAVGDLDDRVWRSQLGARRRRRRRSRLCGAAAGDGGCRPACSRDGVRRAGCPRARFAFVT